jgi:hypothetical protein
MKITRRQLRRIIRENAYVKAQEALIEQIKSRILVIGVKLGYEFSAHDVKEQFMRYFKSPTGKVNFYSDPKTDQFVNYISSSALTVKDIEDIMMDMVQQGMLTEFDPGLFEVHPRYSSYKRDFPY